MQSTADKIREIAGRLLQSGAVDMVIGFRKGTVPMMNEPHVAKTPADWCGTATAASTWPTT